MTPIEEIRSNLRPTLHDLDLKITQALKSDNDLMHSIILNHLKGKGKQLRPIFVILTARLFGQDNESTLNAAAAVELLHNASLIHDDVIDEAQLRHKLPTINSLWDNRIAVLVGDFFVSAALSLGVKTADIRIIEALAKLGNLLSTGEMDQITNARTHSLSVGDYFTVILRKTASLFTACVELGCYTASTAPTESQLQAVRQFATIFGECFQIRDDIYDYYHPEAVGKPTGNDLREGKISLPLIHALSQNTPQAEAMRQIIDNDTLSDQQITRLIDFAKQAGGIDFAWQTLATLSKQAHEVLMLLPPCQARDQLNTILQAVTTQP